MHSHVDQTISAAFRHARAQFAFFWRWRREQCTCKSVCWLFRNSIRARSRFSMKLGTWHDESWAGAEEYSPRPRAPSLQSPQMALEVGLDNLGPSNKEMRWLTRTFGIPTCAQLSRLPFARFSWQNDERTKRKKEKNSYLTNVYNLYLLRLHLSYLISLKI